LELEEPEHDTLIFIDWFLDEEFTIPFTSETVPDEDVTLYAQFVPNAFKITFDNNGGIGYSSITTMYNTPIPNPTDPKKEGYIFIGYYLDEDFETPMDWWEAMMPKYNFTVYALFLPVEE